MRLLALLALVASWPAFGAAIDLPVSRVKIAPACEQRTISWTQNAPVASWTLEIRRLFSANGQPAYDAPTVHTIPGTSSPRWQGVLNQAGVFQVRVRANYVEDGANKTTAWSESTDPVAAANNLSFVFVLFLCPPGGFTPN